MRFVLDNIEKIFIGYVKPNLQNDENPKDFFDVVVRKFCENHSEKTFDEVFHLVLEEMPADCVGIVKSSDFSLDLRFSKNKKEGNLWVCDSFFQLYVQ